MLKGYTTVVFKILCVVGICFIGANAKSYSSTLDSTTASLDQLYQAMLSNEYTPIDARSVGHAPAYYAKKGFLWLEKVNFEFIRETDEKWDKRYINNGPPLIVNKGLAFGSCDFPEVFWVMLRNMTFNEAISFVQCTNLRMVFKDCTFKETFLLRVGTRAQFLEFENCVFERGFAIMEGATLEEHLTFKNCTFKYNEDNIASPKVNKDQFNIGELRECPHYFYFGNNKQEIDLRIVDCDFLPVQTASNQFKFYIDLNHSAFKTLELIDCNIQVPLDLSFVSITNQFKIFNTTTDIVAAEAINFNSSNSKIDWDIFKGQKLHVKLKDESFLNGDKVVDRLDKYYFETLISVYTLFYHTYKDQGNMLSANQVYVEWKNIETKYLRKKLSDKPTTQVWFNWFMNAFLKTFCDYGTNPFKSLTWSVIVMLVFTFIFMIYLWNFDTTEHKDIRLVFKNFGLYFVGGKSLLEIGEMMIPKEPNKGSANELREFIYGNKKGLPWYYRIFGLNIARPRFTFRSMFYYRMADRILGRWEEANKWKRFWVAVVVSLWIFGIFIKILLIRIFDAFTMSLNSFSTLGYGDLPRNEAMRYLSILEGFIGWFLLSIFSVSLISQIIQ